MTVFLEACIALMAVGLGVFHQTTWDTNPWLRNINVRVVLGILALCVYGGLRYYGYVEKQQEIESEKWDFARDTNTKESYCTYLKEYPSGIYVNQARNKCYPVQAVIPQPVETSAPIKVTSTPVQPTTQQATTASYPFEPEMVLIKKGCFMMGSPSDEIGRHEDEQQHQVCIDKDFEMGKYEVTQAQWMAVMGNNPSFYKGDNLPLENVSYNDVQGFISKLNARTAKNYRLPTEAEWEYAARAGTTTPFYTGECISTEQANFNGGFQYTNCEAGNYKQTPVAVGSYPANPWGLYDMAGNVSEWGCSAYDENHAGESVCATNTNLLTVIRGGSWDSKPKYLRSVYRNYSLPVTRDNSVGFRLSRM